MKLEFGGAIRTIFGNVSRKDHLLFQVFEIKKNSSITRKTKFDILRDTGVIVMGIRKGREKRFRINVEFKERIKAGDILVMGTGRQLDDFARYLK